MRFGEILTSSGITPITGTRSQALDFSKGLNLSGILARLGDQASGDVLDGTTDGQSVRDPIFSKKEKEKLNDDVARLFKRDEEAEVTEAAQTITEDPLDPVEPRGKQDLGPRITGPDLPVKEEGAGLDDALLPPLDPEPDEASPDVNKPLFPKLPSRDKDDKSGPSSSLFPQQDTA